jgi:hypothetical protein
LERNWIWASEGRIKVDIKNEVGLESRKIKILYLRIVFDMDLAFYLKQNDIETQTANRISAAIKEIFVLDTGCTVKELQCLTIHQVGHLNIILTPEDLKTFKEFHYKYLLEYNKELRQSMQDITKSIEDLHNGNNRLPVVFWNKAAPYTV